MAVEYSVSPDGKKFKIPDDKDYQLEFERIAGIVQEKRGQGFEIVVVMGLGFVGAVMAAVVADSKNKKDRKTR